jgi:signal recognition particle GTPase
MAHPIVIVTGLQGSGKTTLAMGRVSIGARIEIDTSSPCDIASVADAVRAALESV